MLQYQKQWEAFKSLCWESFIIVANCDHFLTELQQQAQIVDPQLLQYCTILKIMEEGSVASIPKNLLQLINKWQVEEKVPVALIGTLKL